MFTIAYRVILGLLFLYLYYVAESRYWWIPAVMLAWSIIGHQLAALANAVGKLSSVPQEHYANCSLEFSFNVKAVLEHSSVDALFEKLKANGKAPADTLAEWRTLLLESYVRKYQPNPESREHCSIKFRIKNNTVYVNEKVDFNDALRHELEIPYRWADGKPVEGPWAHRTTESQLDIRVIVVNGLLHLQVGRFEKEYSPRILRAGYTSVYETHATVTTFPLMHCTYRHGIPVRYLNFTAMATESYKERHTANHEDKKAWNKAWKHQWDDWKNLQRDIAAYRVLCDEADTYGFSMSRWEKLSKSMDDKFKSLLEKNNFKPFSDYWSDAYGRYWNPYCSVFFANLVRQEKDSWRWSVDYYEERG